MRARGVMLSSIRISVSFGKTENATVIGVVYNLTVEATLEM